MSVAFKKEIPERMKPISDFSDQMKTWNSKNEGSSRLAFEKAIELGKHLKAWKGCLGGLGDRLAYQLSKNSLTDNVEKLHVETSPSNFCAYPGKWTEGLLVPFYALRDSLAAESNIVTVVDKTFLKE